MSSAIQQTSNGGSRSPGPSLNRRARELQQPLVNSFRTPNLSPARTPPQIFASDLPLPPLPTVQEDPVLSSPPGLSRRPRADTLPSTFHIGATSSASSTALALRHLNSGMLGPPPTNGSTISLPVSGSTTPVSEYPFSSSLTPPVSNFTSTPTTSSSITASRLRSGSLTLPASGLSNAFGPNVFSSSAWAPQSPMPGGPGTTIVVENSGREEVRSPDSSTYGDDSHVRTLDYLGLDGDSPIGGFGPFTEKPVERSAGTIGDAGRSHLQAPGMHRLGSMGDLSSLSSLSEVAEAHQGRMRSNTVATFPRASDLYRPLPPPTSSSFASIPNGVRVNEAVNEAEEEYFGDATSSYHRSTDSNDSTRLLYSTATSTVTQDVDGFSDLLLLRPETSSSRARAATIGILDDTRETFLRKRAGTTTGITPSHSTAFSSENENGTTGSLYPAANVLVRGMRSLSIGQEETPWSSSRPITPELCDLPPPLQVPTRSLWIGNLNPATSPAELQAVFAPYGPIESLRLIPEKECGFINYCSVSDAVRAKEDVLNRLGGQLKKSSGMVRIGFGKIETATVGPSASRPSPTLVPMNNELSSQVGPTRALWVGSIPSTTTPNHLLAIFGQFGAIESARVLTHKSCGFINYERTEDAIVARKALNGREILGTDVGAVRIGFAKVPPKVVGPEQMLGGIPQPAFVGQQPPSTNFQEFHPSLSGNIANGSFFVGSVFMEPSLSAPDHGEGGDKLDTVVGSVAEMQDLLRELAGDGFENEEHIKLLETRRPPVHYYPNIPSHANSDPSIARRYLNADAPRLREIRKRLDSLDISTEEVDTVAYDLLDECIPLSSDYIGNTLIQKIFERASLPARLALLERIGPHLATIGTHKNGTWAVQKIISSIQEAQEYSLVEFNLKPYTVPLLLNDFGNYVVQGALRFPTANSDFIFDAMVERCWEIGSGRFGARSTRQTLESPQASRYQVKRVAAAIVLNAIPLVSSSNGALLITWLLDTSNFPGRYRLLAPRFLPHLAHLCTHKLASLAVLKIINQRADPASSRLILDALFEPDTKVLDDILGDQTHGTACVTKLITSAYIDAQERAKMIERIKATLTSLRVTHVPAYARLMEAIGMPFQGVLPPPPSLFAPVFQPQLHPQQGLSPSQSWSPQSTAGNYPPYPQFEYGLQYAQYGQLSQPGAPYPYYATASPYLSAPNYAMSSSSNRTNPSPMLAPQASTSSFGSPRMPSGLPGVSSPDPFAALHVNGGESNDHFNPTGMPYCRAFEPDSSSLRQNVYGGRTAGTYNEFVMGNGPQHYQHHP